MQEELFPRSVTVRFGKEWIRRPRRRPLPQPIAPEEQQAEKRSEETLQAAVFLSGEFELARQQDEDIPDDPDRFPVFLFADVEKFRPQLILVVVVEKPEPVSDIIAGGIVRDQFRFGSAKEDVLVEFVA